MGRTRIGRGLLPVLWVVSPVYAELASAEAETPEAEMVLEAGEIDSQTVAAGARAVVVHGRGEWHPASGEWVRLDTSAGYVQAVDAETLVLAREGDLRQERISLDRIQRISVARIRRRVMEGPPSGEAAIDRKTAGGVKSAIESSPSPDFVGEGRGLANRIVKKLGAGALGGILTGCGGTAVGFALAEEDHSEDDIVDSRGVTALSLGAMGYVVGAAVGVSWPDPHDPFIAALGGSALGLGAGLWLTIANPESWPTLLAGPIITATMMSEWFRDPPEDARISVRLSPTPARGVSAVAALRF